MDLEQLNETLKYIDSCNKEQLKKIIKELIRYNEVNEFNENYIYYTYVIK